MKNMQAGESGGGLIEGPGYKIDFNGQWRSSATKVNPNPSLFAGVYESFSNENSTSS